MQNSVKTWWGFFYRLSYSECVEPMTSGNLNQKQRPNVLLIKQFQLPNISIEFVSLKLRSQNWKLHLIFPILLNNEDDLLYMILSATFLVSARPPQGLEPLMSLHIVHFMESLSWRKISAWQTHTHTLSFKYMHCQNIMCHPKLFGSNGKGTCFLSTFLPFNYPQELFFGDVLFKMVMTTRWKK